MHFKRFFSLDELVESIEKVTAADIQRVAQIFFDQSKSP
jgi:predicted Zn-dependent peptidase